MLAQMRSFTPRKCALYFRTIAGNYRISNPDADERPNRSCCWARWERLVHRVQPLCGTGGEDHTCGPRDGVPHEFQCHAPAHHERRGREFVVHRRVGTLRRQDQPNRGSERTAAVTVVTRWNSRNRARSRREHLGCRGHNKQGRKNYACWSCDRISDSKWG